MRDAGLAALYSALFLLLMMLVLAYRRGNAKRADILESLVGETVAIGIARTSWGAWPCAAVVESVDRDRRRVRLDIQPGPDGYLYIPPFATRDDDIDMRRILWVATDDGRRWRW